MGRAPPLASRRRVPIVIERDGNPLDAREGPLALISLKDVRTGPHHVKWLQRVEVMRIGQ